MIFDAYELRARILPTAVVLLPAILVPMAFGVAAPTNWTWTPLAGTALVVLLYPLSMVVRFLGRRIEVALWQSWGGPPTTVLLLESDDTFPPPTKKAIRDAIAATYSINIPAVDQSNPEWAQQVGEAFRLVRQFLRQRDPNGLWFTHNAEYGAMRNLLGATPVMATIAGFSTVLCGVAWYQSRTAWGVFLLILAALFCIVAFIARFWVLPTMTRAAAFRYAESAWLAFLHSVKTGAAAQGGRV